MTKEMTDTEFMSAKDKGLVLKQWETFLKNECDLKHFTRRLYHHLIYHCCFIAHYDLGRFYKTYFADAEASLRFISQFDDHGSGIIPQSAEYGGTRWAQNDYRDVNGEMIRIGAQYAPNLRNKWLVAGRERDLAEARRLLAKHGETS